MPLEIEEPISYLEAQDSPHHKEWMDAMRDKLDSMARNEVWELVDLPPGRKAIGNKWVFKVKRRADGSFDKFKARLVAKGYTQVEDVDYEETFFSCGEIVLCSPTSSASCPFGFRIVPNGCEDCFPQWKS